MKVSINKVKVIDICESNFCIYSWSGNVWHKVWLFVFIASKMDHGNCTSFNSRVEIEDVEVLNSYKQRSIEILSFFPREKIRIYWRIFEKREDSSKIGAYLAMHVVSSRGKSCSVPFERFFVRENTSKKWYNPWSDVRERWQVAGNERPFLVERFRVLSRQPISGKNATSSMTRRLSFCLFPEAPV